MNVFPDFDESFAIPKYGELPLASGGARSGWHVFGAQDQIGRLNLQTPERIVSASRLIVTGEVFSLNLDLEFIDPPLFGRGAPVHTLFDARDEGEFDDKIDNYYPQYSSQWDSLGHFGYSADNFYNGATADQIARGERNTIEHWARKGIAGRGILLDIDVSFGSGDCECNPGDAVCITVDDLERARKRANIEWTPGDIALLHTGYLSWYAGLDPESRKRIAAADPSSPIGFSSIGLERGSEMLAYLWDSGIAGIAADNPAVEVMPFDLRPVSWPLGTLHGCLIGQFGMAIGELWWLHDLAESCRRDSRYEVFLTSAPINMPGGIGSPANALAIR